jgi:tetratricopeptide (TPR) repeat protein
MLEEKPNGAAALNLRAICETRQGKFKDAEKTLDQAIMSNPRDYHAYYNMAHLMLQAKGASGKNAAKRYYETGRAVGGPQDETLKEAVK